MINLARKFTAFRSNEGTYKKTKLEAVIPSLFGVKTMDEVSTIIRVDFIPDEVAFKLPIETFRLANKGDAVAIMIVQEMGRAQGQYAASIVKHLGMEKEKLPLVLIGSLFGTNNPYLIDPYIDEVRRIAKKAFTIIPNFPPVKGAYLLAVDAMVGVASSL